MKTFRYLKLGALSLLLVAAPLYFAGCKKSDDDKKADQQDQQEQLYQPLTEDLMGEWRAGSVLGKDPSKPEAYATLATELLNLAKLGGNPKFNEYAEVLQEAINGSMDVLAGVKLTFQTENTLLEVPGMNKPASCTYEKTQFGIQLTIEKAELEENLDENSWKAKIIAQVSDKTIELNSTTGTNLQWNIPYTILLDALDGKAEELQITGIHALLKAFVANSKTIDVEFVKVAQGK